MADYKFFKNIPGTANAGVIYKEKKWIPFDSGNKDYQEYLEWVEAGNTAEAAD